MISAKTLFIPVLVTVIVLFGIQAGIGYSIEMKPDEKGNPPTLMMKMHYVLSIIASFAALVAIFVTYRYAKGGSKPAPQQFTTTSIVQHTPGMSPVTASHTVS